jgi:hypothetical protein
MNTKKHILLTSVAALGLANGALYAHGSSAFAQMQATALDQSVRTIIGDLYSAVRRLIFGVPIYPMRPSAFEEANGAYSALISEGTQECKRLAKKIKNSIPLSKEEADYKAQLTQEQQKLATHKADHAAFVKRHTEALLAAKTPASSTSESTTVPSTSAVTAPLATQHVCSSGCTGHSH